MSFKPAIYGTELGTPIEYSLGFEAMTEHVGLVAPEITSNHPLDELLLETEQTVAIDEVSLYDGIKQLNVIEPTSIGLFTDWQDSRSTSKLLYVELTNKQAKLHDGNSVFPDKPVPPFSAIVQIGVQPNIRKNQIAANRAFWTGIIACQELVQEGGGPQQLDREVERANRKSITSGLGFLSAFAFVDIMANAYIRKALDISSYDYPKVLGVAAATGVVLAPSFLYLKIKSDERPGITESVYLMKKHKKAARELAAEFPVLQISKAQESDK